MIYSALIKLQKGYGFLMRFRKGINLTIYLTLRCNLKCDYCANKYYTSKTATSELTIEEWKRKIETFPYQIKQVQLTGGEPTLYPEFKELVEYLLSRKIFVIVYTNLTNDIAFEDNIRLRFLSTYHRWMNPSKWVERYMSLNFRKSSVELETNIFPFTNKQNVCSKEDVDIQPNRFIYSPNGKLYTHAREMLTSLNNP
jgi:organic radical activating enzyme